MVAPEPSPDNRPSDVPSSLGVRDPLKDARSAVSQFLAEARHQEDALVEALRPVTPPSDTMQSLRERLSERAKVFVQGRSPEELKLLATAAVQKLEVLDRKQLEPESTAIAEWRIVYTATKALRDAAQLSVPPVNDRPVAVQTALPRVPSMADFEDSRKPEELVDLCLRASAHLIRRNPAVAREFIGHFARLEEECRSAGTLPEQDLNNFFGALLAELEPDTVRKAGCAIVKELAGAGGGRALITEISPRLRRERAAKSLAARGEGISPEPAAPPAEISAPSRTAGLLAWIINDAKNSDVLGWAFKLFSRSRSRADSK